MTIERTLGAVSANGRGRHSLGGQPLVFHCNHYNYWLQKTLLLDDSLGMDVVIRDAAQSVAASCLRQQATELGAEPSARRALVRDTFSELGFGTIDESGLGEQGGTAVFPTSHYGLALAPAAGKPFRRAQNLFDQGYAAGAADALTGRSNGFEGRGVACHSVGDPRGEVRVIPRSGGGFEAVGLGPSRPEPVPGRLVASNVDEPAILAALATLDFSGNEEGLTPRFGVMLTHHFANFYNRISFEFARRMEGSGMMDEAEALLVEAGHRCAFNTFGGIMTSPEWAAVIKPQLKTTEDWAHGMVAVVNALGWGVWRIAELSSRRLVVQAWDDYESMGYLAMYGTASRPVAWLMAGGCAGLMNLIYPGQIAAGPRLDEAFYERIFNSPEAFKARQTKSAAMGDAYSEIVVER